MEQVEVSDLCEAVRKLSDEVVKLQLAVQNEGYRPEEIIRYDNRCQRLRRNMLSFDGGPEVEAGERFIAALPEHEFAIPGQLVADAAINSADHTMLPSPRLIVALTLLLLEEK